MGAMAQQVCVVLSTAEREQLAAIAADPNRPRKHIERARAVLASADRDAAQRVAQSIGVSRPNGVAVATALCRERGRGSAARQDPQARQGAAGGGNHGAGGGADPRLRGGRLCTEPPHQATRWTARAMAKATLISLGSVQLIWLAPQPPPHRLRSF